MLKKNNVKIMYDIYVDNDWALDRSNTEKVIVPMMGGPKQKGGILRIKPKYHAEWKAYVTHIIATYNASYILVTSEAENIWVSAEGYVESLCLAYDAAKKANPQIKVLAGGFNLGGLTLVSDDDLKKSDEEISKEKGLPIATIKHYRTKLNVTLGTLAKGGNCFDMLSIHHDHGNTYDTIHKVVQWYRGKMNAQGYEKPIWYDNMNNGYFPILCDGAPCNAYDKHLSDGLLNGNSDAINFYDKELPKWMVKKAVGGFAAGVGKIFLDTSVDQLWTDCPFWDFVGLLKRDKYSTPKAAYYTAKLMVPKIGNFTKAEKLEGHGIGDHTYKFTMSNGNLVFVAWSDTGNKSINLSNQIGNEKAKIIHIVTELNWFDQPKYTANETVSSSNIEVSEEPIFIEKAE